jgi:DNA-binding beta-propeller fold protein YncE
MARFRGEGCARGRGLGAANAVTVSPDGKNVYVAGSGTDSVAILRRDPDTGGLTQAPGRSACISQAGGAGCTIGEALDDPEDLAVSPDGRNVYVVSGTIHALAVLARNPRTGTLSQLPGRWGCLIRGGVAGCQRARGLTVAVGVTVSRDGRNVYTAGEHNRFGGIGVFRRSPR